MKLTAPGLPEHYCMHFKKKLSWLSCAMVSLCSDNEIESTRVAHYCMHFKKKLSWLSSWCPSVLAMKLTAPGLPEHNFKHFKKKLSWLSCAMVSLSSGNEIDSTRVA